jgi:hypothetical protein
MITYRDYVADEHRRQEMMTYAKQHRLLQNLRNEGAQGASYSRRILSRIGKLFVALGQWMQTENVGRKPTVLPR